MTYRSIGFALVLVTAVSGVVLACKSGNSTSGGGACGTLYDAFQNYETTCFPGTNPAQDLGDRDRFLQECQLDINAPNTNGYEAALNQCASDIDSLTGSCGELTDQQCSPPTGTLANGAACGIDAQCQSGNCKVPSMTTSNGSGGTVTTSGTGCGTCAATAALGEPCGSTDGATCARGLTCQVTTTSSADGGFSETGTCIMNVEADVGAACDDEKTFCKTDGYCDTQMKKCVALGDVGAACQAGECKRTLVCAAGKCAVGKNPGEACTPSMFGSGTGGSGGSGGTGSTDDDCAPGSSCDPQTMKCKQPTLVDPGGTCDDQFLQCKKGFCNIVFNSSPDGGSQTQTGTCPTIIADGMPCTPDQQNAQCDEPAQCISGKCAIFDPSTCK